jgi:hypothetical protein
MKNPHDYSTALVVKMRPALRLSPVFGLSSNIPKILVLRSDLPMPLGGLPDRRAMPSMSEPSAEMGGCHSAEPNEGLFGLAELAVSLMDNHPLAS